MVKKASYEKNFSVAHELTNVEATQIITAYAVKDEATLRKLFKDETPPYRLQTPSLFGKARNVVQAINAINNPTKTSENVLFKKYQIPKRSTPDVVFDLLFKKQQINPPPSVLPRRIKMDVKIECSNVAEIQQNAMQLVNQLFTPSFSFTTFMLINFELIPEKEKDKKIKVSSFIGTSFYRVYLKNRMKMINDLIAKIPRSARIGKSWLDEEYLEIISIEVYQTQYPIKNATIVA